MWSIKSFLLIVCIIYKVSASSSSDDEESAKQLIDLVNIHSKSLNSNNFDSEIDGGVSLVVFYMPDCPISKKFLAKYAKIAETFNTISSIKGGHVDCSEELTFCAERNIDGLEIYLYKEKGEGIKYKGVKDESGITKFLTKHLAADFHSVPITLTENTGAPNELTDETFNDHIEDGNHFIKFYAPWCGHCQRLAPTWDELYDAMEYADGVSISKIDCTQYRPICLDFEVKGYPTLLWIVNGKKIEKYSGPRTLDALKEYVEKMSGTSKANQSDSENVDNAKQHDGENVGVAQLTKGNFMHAIEKGVTFVKFFAPWCGHCKRMAPTWDELAVKFTGNTKIKIAKVDCTIADNKELCGEQEVDGFPTIYLYKDGEKLDEYNGSRSLDDLFEFANRFLPSHDEL